MQIKNPLKSKTFAEFKKFINKGNLVDLAVAVILGAAFSAIVTSLVNDIIMPLINAAAGKSLADLVWVVPNGQPHYLADGSVNPQAIVLSYGNFIQAVINFLIIAVILFVIVKAYLKVSGGFRNKYFGFTKEEYKQFRMQGKTKNDIKLLADKRDEEAAKQAELDQIEKEKNSAESILKDIREILKSKSANGSSKTSKSA
ncbi:MAG: large conductance mechanosensitive channel protein MscL [Malacoplasma sp.]|nr:large conductance mechanosensitive channel protein MscL [Malacoplasma sp.]